VKIYRYWAKASEPVQKADRTWNLECYGGSNSNVEEALRRASERAKAAAAAIRQGSPPDHYEYGERPIREEIVEEFQFDGRTVAVLTRNSYGSLIINTSHALFADIDYRPPSLLATLRDGVGRLFGRQPSTQDEQVVACVRRVVRETQDLGIRLYRTSNGFRCLVTTHTYDPTAQETVNLLQDLDSDPLYVTLCKTHECFRARVSPKPWRCGVPRPASRFPRVNPEAEQAYGEWKTAYQEQADAYSTCALIGDFGASHVHPAVEPVLRLHDGLACSGNGPLA